MEVKIKVVVFEHPESKKVCCACRDICLFTSNENQDSALNDVKNTLLVYLQDKKLARLQKIGWKICDKSIILPNFAEKELVKYASDFFGVKITNYQIIEIYEKTELGD